jgi:Ca2+-binding RTX toxin-like protein
MTQADDLERYMLSLINEARADVGAPALQLELNLNASAEAHSIWMLEEDIFSHTGVGGSSATQRMADAGFDFSGSWRSAENIAVQSERGASDLMDDVLDLHVALMNSPGHRANILNPDLRYIGIGIELGNFDFSSGTFESVIVTQNFAATQGQVELDSGSTGAEPPAPAPPPEPATPLPTMSHDVLTGSDGVDTIKGLGGNDSIAGNFGNDLLFGNFGDDIIFGGLGHDTINGGVGADRLHGEADNDRLFGASGNDTIFGGTGSDTLLGADGHDRLEGENGSDLIKGHNGNDDILGQAGDDLLFGNSGQDTLTGGAGQDRLDGGAGSDVLYGEAGNDQVIGDIGNDTLSGGSGLDKLTGGFGADTFVFSRGSDVDVVRDFEDDTDIIDLRDFGLNSTQDALQFATQKAVNVHFDFGDEDELIIKNMTITDLVDDLLI